MSLRERRRAVVSASIGHTLEWYDFGVYAFVATNIAKQIFPSSSEVVSMLATFLAFGVGFISRPLGGIVLGWFGDKYGSKSALVLSFAMMGTATLCIGLVPTYEAIGSLAPALVVLCRLVQGLSAGGEYAASATYLVAWAPPGRRGLFGSFQQMGSALGALLGSAAGLGLSTALAPEQMMSWGWRVPFLLGGVMLAIGLYLRRNAAPAPEMDTSGVTQADGSDSGSNVVRAVRLAAFAGMWAVPYYLVLFYLPTFFQKTLLLPQSVSLKVSTLSLVVYIALVPLAGHVSDRVGRRKTIIVSTLACAVAALLLFPRMVAAPTFESALAAQLCLNCFLAFVSGTAPTTIVEMFPPRRLAWMNGSYAAALAIFGGFAPAAVTATIAWTGSPSSPMYLIALPSVLLAVVVTTLRETAFVTSRPVGAVKTSTVS